MIHARPDYARIQDPAGLIPKDEPVFLIRGQDISSGDAVRHWADLNTKNGGDSRLSALAKLHARRMDEYPTKKPADLAVPESSKSPPKRRRPKKTTKKKSPSMAISRGLYWSREKTTKK